MQKPDIERRAAELHEGCRMPMEQARELAASEASPDWYARGQDWGLADALTNGQSGDWVLDDIARAFAAGASAAERAGRCAEALPPEVAQARQTAEYWKAEHLAGNARIGELHDELAATALRSADHLRSAIKAEAEVASLRAAALGSGNVIELKYALYRLADAAEALGVNHFGDDWRSDEVQELQAATHAARLALGPNASLSGGRRPSA